MTYDPFKQIGGYFSDAWNTVKSSFGQLGEQLSQTPEAQALQGLNLTPPPQYNNQFVPQANVPTFYQVKPDDTFDTIGNQYGLSASDIQKTNNQFVTPPKGSYIQLPNAYQQSERGQTPTQPPGGSFYSGAGLVNTNVPPSRTNPSYSSPSSAANVNLSEITISLQSQIANGQAPSTVPAQVLASLGATPQSMTAAGYVFNPTNQTWQLGGTGGAPASNNQPDPWSEVKSVYYSKSAGYVTPEVAALKNRRRRARVEAAEWERLNARAPVAQATNAGLAPVSTLDVKMESG